LKPKLTDELVHVNTLIVFTANVETDVPLNGLYESSEVRTVLEMELQTVARASAGRKRPLRPTEPSVPLAVRLVDPFEANAVAVVVVADDDDEELAPI